ncbi:NTF2 fold immunity protein [Chromobacterium subtsugae]|uniref:NTF2 fold immunity protein n=1 Tax=Chromobacterium subtsugae TaxID=251747 RepID=UPI000AC7BEA8|nr:NTF2 fold immunity protein [Chromobacterium subtsugae]
MTPQEIIGQYLKEMLDWEISFYKEQRSEAYKTDPTEREKSKKMARERLRIIFEKYVKDGEQNKIADAALTTMAVGRPPAYEQTIIEEISSTNNYVITKQNSGFENFFRYTLQENDSKWLIEKLHFSTDGKKWKLAESL